MRVLRRRRHDSEAGSDPLERDPRPEHVGHVAPEDLRRLPPLEHLGEDLRLEEDLGHVGAALLLEYGQAEARLLLRREAVGATARNLLAVVAHAPRVAP